MKELASRDSLGTKPSGSLNAFVEDPRRFLFFTGKGGVGKTSLACGTAVALADRGKRVLLVSTDPASNLDEVLGQKLNGSPTAIPGVNGLQALNIDPEAAAQAYRDRMVGPYRGKLPEAILRSVEERLSGACTMEIAAFDEFARLLGEPAATAEFDHVIFDTAPTGHTLRLMTLPTAWAGFLENNTSGASCLGPLAGLQKQRAIYENSVAALADDTRTALILVSRPQKAALDEAERTGNELSALGVRNQRLILNGVFRACCSEDKAAVALERRGASARDAKEDFLERLSLVEVPLHAHNLVGIPALRKLLHNGMAEQVDFSIAGQGLAANGRALLEEDLRSPCTAEIAVFRAFARIVAQGRDRFVVLDTAPTGHTLLLLDATEAYHREIARKTSDLPEEVLQLLPRLRDPHFTRVLIVTLPEATPVHEAAALQTDLRRAQIEPLAWVINQSFARTETRDPLLLMRGAGERPFIEEVTRALSRRTAIVPWVPEEPVGPERLRQLFQNHV